jgi:excisionase family DNA binding protein
VERMLKVEEVAERLSLPASQVRRLIKLGSLPAIRIGRRLRVSEEALVGFVESRRLGRAEVPAGDRPTTGSRG